MKQIVALTLAPILLACVLPMAQAQQDTVPASLSTDPVVIETSPAEASDTSRAEQGQAQKLEQLAKAMQALQDQLQQLELQKQKLQQEMQAISHAGHQDHQAHQALLGDHHYVLAHASHVTTVLEGDHSDVVLLCLGDSDLDAPQGPDLPKVMPAVEQSRRRALPHSADLAVRLDAARLH